MMFLTYTFDWRQTKVKNLRINQRKWFDFIFSINSLPHRKTLTAGFLLRHWYSVECNFETSRMRRISMEILRLNEFQASHASFPLKSFVSLFLAKCQNIVYLSISSRKIQTKHRLIIHQKPYTVKHIFFQIN